ncbi:hypothetical protein ABPG72_012881 [Tetrahymena utriculariae]
MSQSNSTVVVKTFQPSQKEEKLKSKLYANVGSTQKRQIQQASINKPARSSSQQNSQNQQNTNQIQQTQLNQQQIQQNATNPSQFQQIYNQIPDQKVDQFLKQMENELSNLNKKQVSIGMLNSQAQILKEQNEILNQNQKQLQVLMQQMQNEDKLAKQKNELIEQNKKELQKLLAPINEQIQEIKMIYEQTKKSQKEISFQMDKSPASVQNLQQHPQLNQNLQDFQKANSSLKNKLEITSQNLNGFLPENMSAFANMTNFNIDLYTKTINNLKNQILELQRDAQKAEIELEERHEKLNRLPKQKEILIPIQENIQAQVENIDFVSSRQIVNNKLGGELDYELYNESLNELQSDFEALWREYQQELSIHSVHIPKISLTQQEINELSYKMPSVLDDIKLKLGLDPSKPMKNPNLRIKQREQQQNYIEMARQDPDPITNYAKNQTLKPKNLETLKSEPVPCPREVKYEKLEQSQKMQYDTLFANKQQQQQQQIQQQYQKSSLVDIPEFSKPAPYPKITAHQQQQQPESQTFYPKSNVSSMNDIKRKQSSGSFQNKTQGSHQKNKSIQMQSLVEKDMDQELQQYNEIDEGYERYLKIQMDEKITQNLINPYRDNQMTFQKKQVPQQDQQEDQDDQIQISLAKNQFMHQPLDKDSLKDIFLQVLQENKEQIFGNLLQNNQKDFNQNNLNDQNARRKLSDLIVSKDKNENQQSPLKNSSVINQANQNNQQQQHQQQQQQQQQQNQSQQQQVGRLSLQGNFQDYAQNFNIQQQSQDLAMNFLNVINSTLASVNQAVNKAQNLNLNKKNHGLDFEEVSEGSLEDDSMEAGVQNISKKPPVQYSLNNQFSTYGGGQIPAQNFSRQIQQQPFGMTLNPFQLQQQQQQMMMMGGGSMPQPIYPGMMMPATWMAPPSMPNVMQYNNVGNNQKFDQEIDDKKINLNDYYREFQLSDTETVVNQSSISMSQIDTKSNRSYADSIFQSQDNSKSEGQVSVPGRKSISNIKVQNEYYPPNKSTLSQGELSQSHEISQDYSRRRSVDKRPQQNSKYNNQSNKYVGDDIWKDISDEYSEGQI